MAKAKAFDFLFFMAAVPLVVWAGLFGVLSATELNATPMGVFLPILGWCFVFKLIVIDKRVFRVVLALAALTLVLAALDYYLSGRVSETVAGVKTARKPTAYDKMFEFATETVEYALGYRSWSKDYESAIIGASQCVLSLVAAFASVTLTGGVVVAAAFGCGLLICAFGGSLGYDAAVIVYFAAFFAIFVRWLNARNGKERKTKLSPLSNAAFGLVFLPLTVALAFASTIAPKPQRGFAQEVVHNITDAANEPIQTAKDAIESINGGRNAVSPLFTLSQIGFGGGGRLGGNATLTDTPVIQVTFLGRDASNNPTSLWLAERQGGKEKLVGTYFDSYTGYSWNASSSHDVPFTRLEPVANDSAAEFVRVKALGKTKSLFLPQRLIDLTNGEFFTDDELSVASKRVMDAGEEYTAEYYPSGIYSPAPLHSLYGRYNAATGYWGGLPVLSDKDKERYLKLPDELPQRVRDYAFDLLSAWGRSDEDVSDCEKAMVLESVLAWRKPGSIGRMYGEPVYKYTLKPGDVPEGRDFVDYFLFDNPNGYCVYFASAFVVLCRSVGLPARYAEGYVMPSETTNGSYIVTGKQGHAWAEVYFDEFGWVAFDPTPFDDYGNVIAGGSAMPTASPYDFDENTPDKRDEDAADYGDDYNSRFDDATPTPAPPIKGGKPSNPNNSPQMAAFLNEINLVVKMLLSAVILAALILVQGAARYVMRGRRQLRAAMSGPNEEAMYYFERTIMYAPFFHYERQPDETALMFAERSGKAIYFDNETRFLRDAADVYAKAKYRRGIIGEDELDLVKRAYHKTKSRFRRNAGRIKYLWAEYVRPNRR